jgi:uncharacterized membrane protein (DUF2068 family)
MSLLHHDLRHLALELIGYFGLDPGARYSSILLRYADTLADANLRSLFLLAAGYIVLRFAEAYGLWYQRMWGQWLAAASGALYIPFEVRHLMHSPSLIGAAVLAANLLVVAYLLLLVWRERRGSV